MRVTHLAITNQGKSECFNRVAVSELLTPGERNALDSVERSGELAVDGGGGGVAVVAEVCGGEDAGAEVCGERLGAAS